MSEEASRCLCLSSAAILDLRLAVLGLVWVLVELAGNLEPSSDRDKRMSVRPPLLDLGQQKHGQLYATNNKCMTEVSEKGTCR